MSIIKGLMLGLCPIWQSKNIYLYNLDALKGSLPSGWFWLTQSHPPCRHKHTCYLAFEIDTTARCFFFFYCVASYFSIFPFFLSFSHTATQWNPAVHSTTFPFSSGMCVCCYLSFFSCCIIRAYRYIWGRRSLLFNCWFYRPGFWHFKSHFNRIQQAPTPRKTFKSRAAFLFSMTTTDHPYIIDVKANYIYFPMKFDTCFSTQSCLPRWLLSNMFWPENVARGQGFCPKSW